jgi:WD40 repeat protein
MLLALDTQMEPCEWSISSSATRFSMSRWRKEESPDCLSGWVSIAFAKLSLAVSYSRNVADGPPILATSSTTGSIAIWDLGTKGRILHVLRDAHEAPVTGLQWVMGQPLLISSSGDNSVKVSSLCTRDLRSLLTHHHHSNGSLTPIQPCPDS